MGEGDAIQVCAHTPIERRTREWERKRLGGIEDQISSRRDRMRDFCTVQKSANF